MPVGRNPRRGRRRTRKRKPKTPKEAELLAELARVKAQIANLKAQGEPSNFLGPLVTDLGKKIGAERRRQRQQGLR